MSPQTSVNSGTKRAINFEHVLDLNPKHSAHDDGGVTGLNISKDKNLKGGTSQENPDAKLIMDVDTSDDDSINNDGLIDHPTKFKWYIASIIKESCEKICASKSIDMKAVTSVEEMIDVILNYLSANDLKIHLTSVRPRYEE